MCTVLAASRTSAPGYLGTAQLALVPLYGRKLPAFPTSTAINSGWLGDPTANAYMAQALIGENSAMVNIKIYCTRVN